VEQLKRLGLRAAMLLVGLNIWTGSPLLAVWIGSRLQGDSGAPKMGPVFAVVVIFAGLSFALAFLLSRLGAAYDQLTGREVTVHRQSPWLRSMRGERPNYPGEERPQSSALEKTLVLVVVACAIAFEVWFFFFSGSPI
jgi:hypothetical protein